LLVGHSVGSAISIAEAANSQYAHVDGIILTGFLHFVDPNELVTISNDIYPANQDPDPRFKALPPGYLTTKPNTRGQIFYYLPNSDAQAIGTDEQTKETITDNELTTFFSIAASPLSQRIQVPVLVVVGQYDNIFCLGTFSCTNSDTVKQYESAYYAPQAQLQLLVIPQAGHDLNLQKTASTAWYPQAITWIKTHV
jgi:pimeloyl-ACP methyl ester carboxylesterase